MVGRTKAEISAANRRRYEELRAAGQEATPKALPPATALDGAPIAPQAVISREEVPPGWYDTVRLRRGEALRIVDTSGRVQRVGGRLVRARSVGAHQLRRHGQGSVERRAVQGAGSSCRTWDGFSCP